ncbi:XrtA/PEP-CTERM system histidine kinase PrsK [Falsiroseomonas selenitidurans]|uniref:histidine kinase n=1 Tax=Falsiroseomonas selenitidurans TaxID=2716335 RepID=A0ABX1E0D1_9PROT|nr:XrtA/PEP-CTERM system histidine kinase PrsK [Falsiroseomonas selenitidurans]NKC30558.1 PEP-CTERM system histidine kinase PrsK [Falsiroseomonas selenitidurans]
MTAAASSAAHGVAAALCLAWVVLILAAGRGRAGYGAALAAAAASAWAAAVAWQPAASLAGLPGALEVLRSAVWLGVLLVLSHRLGGGAARRQAWRFGAVGLAATLLALLPVPVLPTLGSPGLLARLGLALLVLLVAENLFRNADRAARWHAILPCLALGGLSVFDVLLHADAALHRGYAPALLDARAVLTALALALLILSAARDRRWRQNPPVSREVVFHGATLVLAGTFLTGVGAVGEGLRYLGAGWAGAAQASLLAGAVLALAVAASSASMRSRLRRRVVDHFFTARFDYRAEWLRCVATLSAHDAEAESRAITAIADPVDSPAGVLLLRDAEAGPMRWAGSWNRPVADLALPPDHPLLQATQDGTRIVTEVPAGLAPGLSPALDPLWLAVPLRHHREGLLGLVLLAPPRAAFRLDAEAFDLLRAVGREVAMFLAERRAAERLHDQRALAEHAQRFAFVAHDVKNVANQLTLVLRNAEHNMAEPDFQQDMLLTVGAAARRITALIARLREPEAEATPARIAPLETVRDILREVAHPVQLDAPDADAVRIAIAPDRFAAALRHLLDNAIEASPPGVPVRLALRREGGRLVLDIVDRGPGMTPAFVRDRLFRPLVSGRTGGNGIGAWQARDLLRGAGGDLEAMSRPGAGTTMRLTLPCTDDNATNRLKEIAA